MCKLTIILSVVFAAVILGGEQRSKPLKPETATGYARVKVKVEGQWVTFKELAQLARITLNQKDLPPPAEIKPLFDLMPGEKIFLRVNFSQGIGKRCWYVEYDKDGKVLETGSVITKG
jgi:hypothetical protein